MSGSSSSSLSAASGLRVVLIEDHPGDARLFSKYAQEGDASVDVRWEETLSTGIAAVTSDPPDVMVVDLGLPDSDGVDTVRRCVEVAPCPVVVLTGRDAMDTAMAVLEAGAAEYLQKNELTPGLVTRMLRWAAERARMTDRLSRQNTWIRSVTENISSGIYRSTAEDGLVYVNEAFAHLFGYESPAAVMQAVAKDLYVYPERREELLRRQRRHGGIDDEEIHYRRKDGSTFVGLVSSAAVQDGDVVYYDGTVVDITERRTMETKLRRSRKRLTHAQHIASLGSYERDFVSGELYWSSETYRIFGLDPDRRPTDFDRLVETVVHPDDRAALRRQQEQATAGDGPIDIEYRIRRPDGDERFVHERGEATLDDDGTVLRLTGTVLDITQRKQAETQIRQSRERWQRLVENQRDAIHITVDGEIRYINPSGADLLGADAPEDLVGRTIWEFLPSEVKADMRERADMIRRGEPTPPYEHEVERLDGERRIVETYSTPTNHKGERAAQTVVRDLTERRRTQRQLQQAQKMETVGALAGGIAHDFNNILHAVTAYVEMVHENLSENNPNRMFLDRAAQGLDRASSLVQKILTFSQHNTTTTTEPIDVGAVVRESIGLVKPSLSAGVTVRQDLDDDCTVVGESGSIHQVATNIMTNAGQAMADDPDTDAHVLDVDVSAVDVDHDLARQHLNLAPGRYVRLSISDTGTGMDADTKDRLFEPFFTTKELGKGTGLGLSVVHGIVQAHDGEIAVYSEPGKGTTFDVYLPHASNPEADASGARADDEPPAEHAGHVLVVDDDRSITELESMRLRRLGYTVTCHTSAAAVLQAIDDTPAAFDLILTDYAMPGMNGLALTRALRERDYDGPVILMSGFSAQVAPEDMQEAGVTSFLRKPVGSDELKQTLVRLLAAAM